jgi:GntR family transcriptional regulator
MLDRLRIQQDGVPIYVQLRQQILQAIGDGTLAPGAQLPTMREVAVALKVDLNTVQRAYAALERDGVLITARGRGSFVAEKPPRADPASRQAAVERLAFQTIASAQSQGVDPAEVGRMLLRLAEKKPKP